MNAEKKITLAHVISAQDPQTFYNQKEKFVKEYGENIRVSCLSITPIMVNAQVQTIGGNPHQAAQLVLIPAIYYELEFTETQAKEFRLGQSLIIGR